MSNVLLLGVLNLEHHTTVEAQGVIQDINHNAPLTSSEIARLWQTNLYFSTIMCITKHLLNTLGDPDLRPPLEFGLSICEDRVNLTGNILSMEGQPVPKGFEEPPRVIDRRELAKEPVH